MHLPDNLIIITAPSGAGKSTIISRLMQKHPQLVFSVSHTTRTIRKGERDGVDYYFISKTDFEKMIKNDEFLEWAIVHGNYYGTSYQEIEKKTGSGCRVVLDIDVQGALALKKKQVPGWYIFIKTKDIATLRQRLLARGKDSRPVIEKRVKNAAREVAFSKKWKHVIINDNLDQAVADMENLLHLNIQE